MPARTRQAAAGKAPSPAAPSKKEGQKTKDKPVKRLGQTKKTAAVETTEKAVVSTSKAVPASASGPKISKIRIEHCTSWQVFKRKAQGVISALSEAGLCVDKVETVINEEKPKRGSFEVTVVLDNGTEANVWSGIKKGPPRKLKFPEPDVIVDAVKKIM